MRALLTLLAFVSFPILLKSQDLAYTTVVRAGDLINSPGSDGAQTVNLISSINWAGTRLGVQTRDTSSRTYFGFWEGNSLDYFVGTGTSFPAFAPTSPATNREGNPPGDPRMSVGPSPMGASGVFAFRSFLNDATTLAQENWTALIAADGSGFSQWAEPFFADPVLVTRDGSAAYVEGNGDGLNEDGWIFSNGGFQIVFGPDTPIPAALTGATFLFPGSPVEVFEDGSVFFDGSYSANDGAGLTLLHATQGGTVSVLVDDRKAPPEHPDIAGADDWTYAASSARGNRSGTIAFSAIVQNTGTYVRRTLWTVSAGSAPTFVVSSDIAYDNANGGTVTFENPSSPHIDAEGNVYFNSQVVGESSDSVWRKRLSDGLFERLSPSESSPIPGYPNTPLRDARIVTMNSSGRLVLSMAGFETAEPFRSIQGYFLQDKDGAFRPAAIFGEPLEEGGGVVGSSFAPDPVQLSDTHQLAINIRIGGINSIVVTQAPGDIVAQGDTYIWNGALEDGLWHSTSGGVSNWEDAAGTPWPAPPNSANAEVTIPAGASVVLSTTVTEIATLHSEGELSVEAKLSIFEDALFNDLTILEPASLDLKGSVVATGEVTGWFAAIETDSDQLNQKIETRGELTAADFGIRAHNTGSLEIENSGTVSGIAGLAISATSTTGDIVIENRGDLDASMGDGIRASASLGAVTISSPASGQDPSGIRISTTDGNGISASASDAVQIAFNGELNTLSSSLFNKADGIDAISFDDSVEISALGTLTSSGANASAIRAIASQDLTVDVEAILSTDGFGIIAETESGPLTIRAADSTIAASLGGILATGGNGLTTIESGEIDANGTGVDVDASGQINLISDGAITIIQDSVLGPSHGIEVKSDLENINLEHSGDISVTTSFASSAIIADANATIIADISGGLSTLRGDTVSLFSRTGGLSLDFAGSLDTSSGGSGLSLISLLGPIILNASAENNAIATSGDGETSSAISAAAGGEIEINWTGTIETEGAGAHGIFVDLASQSIQVGFEGERIAAQGSNSDGIHLSGTDTVTLYIDAGEIEGGEDNGVGVRLDGGTDNLIVNNGAIASRGGYAIVTTTGDDVVENISEVYGIVDLGTGSNVFENELGARFETAASIELGANNQLFNEGILQIGETGTAPLTTTLNGDLGHTANGQLRIGVDAAKQNDRLVVNGTSTLAGELQIEFEVGYAFADGDRFEVFQSTSLSGTFGALKTTQNGLPFASRFFEISLDQSATAIAVMIDLAPVTDYNGWRDRFFDPEDADDDEISDPNADPDKDGLVNQMEYVFGTYPLIPDDNPLFATLPPPASPDATTASVSFPWANEITDLDWKIQTSQDLDTWTDIDTTLQNTEAGSEVSRLTVTFDTPVNPQQPLHLRLVLVAAD